MNVFRQFVQEKLTGQRYRHFDVKTAGSIETTEAVLVQFHGTEAADVIMALCRQLALDEDRIERMREDIIRLTPDPDGNKLEIDLTDLGKNLFLVEHATGGTEGNIHQCLTYITDYLLDLSRHGGIWRLSVASYSPAEGEESSE